jgi:hypothetical protein
VASRDKYRIKNYELVKLFSLINAPLGFHLQTTKEKKQIEQQQQEEEEVKEQEEEAETSGILYSIRKLSSSSSSFSAASLSLLSRWKESWISKLSSDSNKSGFLSPYEISLQLSSSSKTDEEEASDEYTIRSQYVSSQFMLDFLHSLGTKQTEEGEVFYLDVLCSLILTSHFFISKQFSESSNLKSSFQDNALIISNLKQQQIHVIVSEIVRKLPGSLYKEIVSFNANHQLKPFSLFGEWKAAVRIQRWVKRRLVSSKRRRMRRFVIG